MKMVHWPLIGGWAVTFGTARWSGRRPPRPSRCTNYQM